MVQFHINLFADPFTCSWEQAAAALESLSRMIFEPDGSWVWSGGIGDKRWQIDGHLFDFAGRLHRVELHGACPAEAFDQLLTCFGWPEVPIEIELVREGIRLDLPDYLNRISGGK